MVRQTGRRFDGKFFLLNLRKIKINEVSENGSGLTIIR